MKFTNASVIEDVVWSLRLSEFTRGISRARINSLFNGFPPFTEKEVLENGIKTNVNFLEAPNLAHDGRRQLYNAFLKPGGFFTIRLDSGPIHKRSEWSSILTKEINRRMKRNSAYMESLRATFASVVLHGIGPVAWPDREKWCPEELGIEDVLVPSQTRVSLNNLSFFAIWRTYTVEQLKLMTSGPKVDPAWQMDLVNKAIKWADSQRLGTSNWDDAYAPEKLEERLKSDLGIYSSDQVPTIDCWDFYFYNDHGSESGWNRRIILDAEWGLGVGGIDVPTGVPSQSKIGTRGKFLYDPGNRKYADKLSQIAHWQFGDLSSVAPFRYHSVRSLGFLLFAICHLQNRLRCRFVDHAFENLCQYFRVANVEDSDRAIKINLYDKVVVDEGVRFIPQSERWQINDRLIESALGHMRELMGANSSSFTQDYDFGKEHVEKTARQVTAEVTQSSALVGAMLMQAYNYAEYQYREICRRFCVKNSRDPDVRKFRVNVLKQGVPEDMLDEDRWEIAAERVLGSGNKMLEVGIAEKLMAARNFYDPESQRIILRDYTLALTDDAGKTEALVPMQPVQVTDAVHDAQLASAALMMGLPVALKKGLNHIEYADTLLANMASIIQRIEQAGGASGGNGNSQGMATEEQVIGLQNMAQHVAQHIQIVAQDPNEKQRVKVWGDALGKMSNMIRAYGQRIAEARQAGNGSPAGPDLETAGKVQAMQIQAEAKAANVRESHSQKTAQRQVQWEQQQKQQEDQHQLELRRKAEENAIDLAAQELNAEKKKAAAERSAAE